MDRKLAAILAADVVGYSAMMERDETRTHERLQAGLREVFETTIARHHGTRWRDLTFNFDPAILDRQVADLVKAGLSAS